MRYEHFTQDELACRCGCSLGEDDMNPETMARLMLLRQAVGFALPVSSAVRCSAHNRAVSTTGPDGPHTTGQSVDIRVAGRRALRVIAEAERLGFTGIGVSQRGPMRSRFVHLDDLAIGRPHLWGY